MNYMIGCNFWDSKSGTDMWKNWDADSVFSDLSALSENGVRYLRVFPNWRDFQPITHLRGWRGKHMEYRLSDDRPLFDEFGLDHVMLEHFESFCDIAEKTNIKLIVSIITGWMSGRLFVPPALEGKNPISDPEMLKWETKFARGFVRRFKNRKEIVAWDLGNECNCLGEARNEEEAWLWTSTIRNAILSEDNSRIIMSGMHSLGVNQNENPWTVQDQGELTDVLCPHPYPSPTVGGDVEPANTVRTTLIPTAQVVYYSSISGKPAMIQESGTFNDMVCCKSVSAEFLRVNLLSGYANGSLGYLWWCSHEHLHLKNPPYSWSMVERELGLLYPDRSPKPVALEMKRLTRAFENLPDALPKRDIDAVCVTTKDQDFWHIAVTSYILAKQAGIEMEFAYCEQKLPKAKMYIVPSICGWAPFGKELLDSLLERANDGSTVLFTIDTGMITTFENITGLRSMGMMDDYSEHICSFDGTELPFTYCKKYLLSSIGADVIASDDDGTVIFSKNKYGKGNIYVLDFPLEKNLWDKCGVFTDKKLPYYKIYKNAAEGLDLGKIATSSNPLVGVTQHKSDDGYYVVAVNYSDKDVDMCVEFADGIRHEIIYGNPDKINACDAVIFKTK